MGLRKVAAVTRKDDKVVACSSLDDVLPFKDSKFLRFDFSRSALPAGRQGFAKAGKLKKVFNSCISLTPKGGGKIYQRNSELS
ncbi:MAG: hypothetical protein WBA16_03050 [Nonlabens sp.]